MNSERLGGLLAELGVDGVLATSYPNVFHLSGYLSATGRLYPQNAYWCLVSAADPARPYFVMPAAEIADLLDAGVDAEQIACYGRAFLDVAAHGPGADRELAAIESALAADPVAALRGLLDRLGLAGAVVWVDGDDGGAAWRRLAGLDVAARWADTGADLVGWARVVKSPAEVEGLRRAGQLNEQAVLAGLAVLGAGGTDREVEQAWRAAVVRAGGLPTFFMGGSGERSAAFRRPNDRRAATGERFRWDCGLVAGGWCADTGGTVQVRAEPSAGELAVYRALTEGLDAVLGAALPGVGAATLYALAGDTIRRAGVPAFRHPHVGHGIGVEARDLPLLAAAQPGLPRFLPDRDDLALAEGMVLNVEVPYGVLGEHGYQHEVTFVVEHGGTRLLTRRHPYYVAAEDGVHETTPATA